MPEEIESRYRLATKSLYRHLLRLNALGPYTLMPQGWQQVRDCYLDTADRALGHQGWACRLRYEDGLRRTVTLKGPPQPEGPGVRRVEYEIILSKKGLDPAGWPAGELRDLALRLSGGAPLQCQIRLRQHRYHLYVAEGQRSVARLSLDRLHVQERGARRQCYLAECELIGQGQLADLAALDELLVASCGLAREPRSKRQLAQDMLDDIQAAACRLATPMGLRPDDPVPVAAARVLTYHTQRMLANEPGVRQGLDPEAIHDMRVATRRLRSALRFFGPFMRDPQIASLEPRLQRLGRLLGRVRDLDVALERAQTFAAEHPHEGRLTPLLGHWERQRARENQRLIHYLDTPGYAHWLQRWQELLARLEHDQDRSEASIGAVAPLLLYLQWRSVWAFDHVLSQAPIEVLHALRIACKRLRYGLEFCAEVLPLPVVRRIPEVIALQDHLGALNDHATAVAMLEAALAHIEAPEARRAIRAYSTYSRQQAADLAKSFRGRWNKFTRHSTRRAFASLTQ